MLLDNDQALSTNVSISTMDRDRNPRILSMSPLLENTLRFRDDDAIVFDFLRRLEL